MRNPQLKAAYIDGINSKGTFASLQHQAHLTAVGTRKHAEFIQSTAIETLPKTCALESFQSLTESQIERIPDYAFSIICLSNLNGKPGVLVLHECDDPKANYHIFKTAVVGRFSEPKWSKKWEFPTLFQGKKAGWLWIEPVWYSQVKTLIRYLQSSPPTGLGMKQIQKPTMWEGSVSFD